jgi:hypothetical protein
MRSRLTLPGFTFASAAVTLNVCFGLPLVLFAFQQPTFRAGVVLVSVEVQVVDGTGHWPPACLRPLRVTIDGWRRQVVSAG